MSSKTENTGKKTILGELELGDTLIIRGISDTYRGHIDIERRKLGICKIFINQRGQQQLFSHRSDKRTIEPLSDGRYILISV